MSLSNIIIVGTKFYQELLRFLFPKLTNINVRDYDPSARDLTSSSALEPRPTLQFSFFIISEDLSDFMGNITAYESVVTFILFPSSSLWTLLLENESSLFLFFYSLLDVVIHIEWVRGEGTPTSAVLVSGSIMHDMILRDKHIRRWRVCPTLILTYCNCSITVLVTPNRHHQTLGNRKTSSDVSVLEFSWSDRQTYIRNYPITNIIVFRLFFAPLDGFLHLESLVVQTREEEKSLYCIMKLAVNKKSQILFLAYNLWSYPVVTRSVPCVFRFSGE